MTSPTSTTRKITAPAAQVWQLLSDTEWWNRADNGVLRVAGSIRRGEKIELVSALQPKRGFTLEVAEAREPTRMTWTGGLPLGLCTGRRTFLIEPDGEASCTFTMAEDFTGPLSALIIRSMPDFQASFDQFARALKSDSEARSS